MFLLHPRVKVSIVGSLRDREVACSASDRHGSNFESCVWRTMSSQSSHHPQEVLLAQFSLYVHKGGLKPDSFHFIFFCRDAQLFVRKKPSRKVKVYVRLIIAPLWLRREYHFLASHTMKLIFFKCLYNYVTEFVTEPPEGGVMNALTMSSRHMVRNSGLGGLRSSTIPFGHGGSPQF